MERNVFKLMSSERAITDTGSISVSSFGETITLKIASYRKQVINGKPLSTTINTDFKISSLPSWMTVSARSDGDGKNYTLTINCSENTGTDRSFLLGLTQNLSDNEIHITVTQLATTLTCTGIMVKSWSLSSSSRNEATLTFNTGASLIYDSNGSDNNLQIFTNTGDISKVLWAKRIRMAGGIVTRTTSGYTYQPTSIVLWDATGSVVMATTLSNSTLWRINMDSNHVWVDMGGYQSQVSWSNGGTELYSLTFSVM